jgi:hypothetical protein
MVKTKKYLKKNKRKTRRGGTAIFGSVYKRVGKTVGFSSNHKKKSENIEDYFLFEPITRNDLSVPRYFINMNIVGFGKLYLKDSIGQRVTALKNSMYESFNRIDNITLENRQGTIFMSGNFKIGKNKTHQSIWEVEEIFPITLSLEQEQYRPLKLCSTELEYETNEKILNNTLYGQTFYKKHEYKFINLNNKEDSEQLPNVSNDDILYKAIQLLYRYLKTKVDLYQTEENNFVFTNTSLEIFSEQDTYVRINYNVSDIIEFKLEPNIEESVLECYYIHNDNLFIIVGI